MSLEIEIDDQAWAALPGLEALSQKVATAVLQGEQRDICVLFTSNAAVQDMNRTWRGKDKPTNVLSFPFQTSGPMPDDEIPPLGDIALAFETVAGEAQDQNKSLSDHTCHLMVHGILHLMGYDHEIEAEAEVMERREREILLTLGIKDPYET